MRYREQPMRRAAGPTTYPAPDWLGIASVARVWVPDDETVGYLIRQGETALSWWPTAARDSLGYIVAEQVRDLIADGARRGLPALETWTATLAATLHETPRDEYLAAWVADRV